MPTKTILCALDLEKAETAQQATVFQIANLCAVLFRNAGSHVSVQHSACQLVRGGDCIGTGVLAAAIEMRTLLLNLPNGRKALRDLGFEPVTEHVEGE